MPDSVSTKWHMIIGTSNFLKTEIFVHSYNPTPSFLGGHGGDGALPGKS